MTVKQTAGRDQLGAFAPEFAHLNDDVLFGEVWNRTDALSLRDRSLVTVATLMAMGITDSSLGYHLRTARANGITQREIAEIITHAAFYMGWPKAWAAFGLAKGVWADGNAAGEDATGSTPDTNAGNGDAPSEGATRTAPNADTSDEGAADADASTASATSARIATRAELERACPFPIGEPNDTYAAYFDGQSYLAPVSTEQITIHNVTFEPGCRNHWHIHHAKSGGGQLLICVAGRGWYQEWGKPARALMPGDVVNIPANVKHWHGAAADSWFSHLAMGVPGTEQSNEWCEPVDAEGYAALV